MENKDNKFTPTSPENMVNNSIETVTRKVDSFLTIMKRLCVLIDKENKAINDCDFKEVRRLQEHKLKFTSAYTEGFKTVTSLKGHLSSLSAEMKKDLEVITIKLGTLMQKNALLLKASINANKKMVDTIVKAADQKNRESKGFYGSNGMLGDSSQSKYALSINTVL